MSTRQTTNENFCIKSSEMLSKNILKDCKEIISTAYKAGIFVAYLNKFKKKLKQT